MSTVECPRPKTRDDTLPAYYAIEDRVVIQQPARIEQALDVWIPLISDAPSQRVLNLSIDTNCSWSVTREIEFGNQMLHARVSPAQRWPLQIALRYQIERLPVAQFLHAACVRPLQTPELFARHLAAEQFVEVSERTRALAAGIVSNERNALEQARLLYRYVTATMTYDAANQSWKGSTEHALVCSAGNCNDIHALFISLARSIGIPARLILGQALESQQPPGSDACELCGYHCWAECFVAGLGWIAVDASCACKYGTEGLFGRLEMNHVAWSVGRDLMLAPPQHGPRLLFFAAPHAEIDGESHRAIERHLSFAEQ